MADTEPITTPQTEPKEQRSNENLLQDSRQELYDICKLVCDPEAKCSVLDIGEPTYHPPKNGEEIRNFNEKYSLFYGGSPMVVKFGGEGERSLYRDEALCVTQEIELKSDRLKDPFKATIEVFNPASYEVDEGDNDRKNWEITRSSQRYQRPTSSSFFDKEPKSKKMASITISCGGYKWCLEKVRSSNGDPDVYITYFRKGELCDREEKIKPRAKLKRFGSKRFNTLVKKITAKATANMG
jgi:hypothetical protein